MQVSASACRNWLGFQTLPPSYIYSEEVLEWLCVAYDVSSVSEKPDVTCKSMQCKYDLRHHARHDTDALPTQRCERDASHHHVLLLRAACYLPRHIYNSSACLKIKFGRTNWQSSFTATSDTIFAVGSYCFGEFLKGNLGFEGPAALGHGKD